MFGKSIDQRVIQQQANERLESLAKETQEKLGGGRENSAVIVTQVAVPSASGKKSEEKLSFLERENMKLKASLKDCEEALQMANVETGKANKVVRDVKLKLSDMEKRMSDRDREMQEAGANVASLELELKEAKDERAQAEKQTSELKAEVKLKLSDMEKRMSDGDRQIQKARAKVASLELDLKEAKDERAQAEKQTSELKAALQQVEQTKTTVTGNLKSSVHDREAKFDELKHEIADRDAKIAELSSKAEHFESRAIPAEKKAAKLDESTKRLKERENKLSDIGESKQQGDATIAEYQEELRHAVTRANRTAAALRTEQKKTAAWEEELQTLRKHTAEDDAHARVLAERIGAIENVISVAEDESLESEKDVDDTKSDEQSRISDADDCEDNQTADKATKEVPAEKGLGLLSTIGGLRSRMMGAFSRTNEKDTIAKDEAEEAKKSSEKADDLQSALGSQSEKLNEKERVQSSSLSDSRKLQSAEKKATAATAARAGEQASSTDELQSEKDTELRKMDELGLRSSGERLADLTEKMKSLQTERDDALQLATTKEHKVKGLEAKIAELEVELNTANEKVANLEEQLEKVVVKVEEHKSAIKGCGDAVIAKAKKAAQLEDDVKHTEENVRDDDERFTSTVVT